MVATALRGGCDVVALGGRRAPRRSRGQHEGEEDDYEDYDGRAGCDQPAEPVEQAAYGASLYLAGRDGPVRLTALSVTLVSWRDLPEP